MKKQINPTIKAHVIRSAFCVVIATADLGSARVRGMTCKSLATLAAILTCLSVSARAGTIYITPNDDYYNVIVNAPPNTIIHLATGSYRFDNGILTLPSGVQLIADPGAGVPRIYCTSSAVMTTLVKLGNNCVLRNLAVDSSAKANSTAVLGGGTGVSAGTIEGCNITGESWGLRYTLVMPNGTFYHNNTNFQAIGTHSSALPVAIDDNAGVNGSFYFTDCNLTSIVNSSSTVSNAVRVAMGSGISDTAYLYFVGGTMTCGGSSVQNVAVYCDVGYYSTGTIELHAIKIVRPDSPFIMSADLYAAGQGTPTIYYSTTVQRADGQPLKKVTLYNGRILPIGPP